MSETPVFDISRAGIEPSRFPSIPRRKDFGTRHKQLGDAGRAADPVREDPAAAQQPQGVLRNGSVGFVNPPQFPETQEHGQRPFELAVEMGLVAREPFKLVGIE